MSTPVSEPDGGALSIPAADGYHYADDHPWSTGDQKQLTKDLWRAVHRFGKSRGKAPVYDPQAASAEG